MIIFEAVALFVLLLLFFYCSYFVYHIYMTEARICDFVCITEVNYDTIYLCHAFCGCVLTKNTFDLLLLYSKLCQFR